MLQGTAVERALGRPWEYKVCLPFRRNMAPTNLIVRKLYSTATSIFIFSFVDRAHLKMMPFAGSTPAASDFFLNTGRFLQRDSPLKWKGKIIWTIPLYPETFYRHLIKAMCILIQGAHGSAYEEGSNRKTALIQARLLGHAETKKFFSARWVQAIMHSDASLSLPAASHKQTTLFLPQGSEDNDENLRSNALHDKFYLGHALITFQYSLEHIILPTLICLLRFRFIFMVGLLMNGPELTVAVKVGGKVLLQEGATETILFDHGFSEDISAAHLTQYSIGFDSKHAPFCFRGRKILKGFKSENQADRFHVLNQTKLHFSVIVNLQIRDINTEDRGVYKMELKLRYHNGTRKTSSEIKDVDVFVPFGKAKCYIAHSQHNTNFYEVHCRASTGGNVPSLSCFQDDVGQLPYKNPIANDGTVISADFWITGTTAVHCCSHSANITATQESCNDFEWPFLTDEDEEEEDGSTMNINLSNVTTTTSNYRSTDMGAMESTPSKSSRISYSLESPFFIMFCIYCLLVVN